MTLLAAFAALLERHTGQDDLVVGTPIAGRTQGQTEGLIGLFVNTLALRVDLGGSPSFLELLGRVREMALAAYAHQELPFERLVEELAPGRDLSRTPLVQAMLVLQNTPAGTLALPGLELAVVPVGNGMATFELTVTCIETAEGLATTFEYDRDLFDAATIARLAGHFERLLAAALDAPAQLVGDLALLGDAERRELLAWGTAPRADRRPTTVPALFAAQAARAPEAVALSYGGETLTYGELDRRVDQLARHLRRSGVAPETIVGVCLEPSIELTIALLAVWRAGGAFLPLDPAYPVERLAFMLEDSGAPLLLTRRGLVEPAVAGVSRLLIEDLLENLAAADAGEVPWASGPEHLAYVIYTSGSTGRPKGVAVQQGAAAEHMATVAAAWELAGGDRVLQFASPSFDVWLEETLPALIAGATLVLRGTELWEPARFLDRIRALSLTVIDLPTAYWQQWLREDEGLAGTAAPAALPLRLVVVGGEAMPAEAARLWGRSPLGGVRLLNAYGPTEGVISATFHAVDPLAEGTSAAVALGAPLAGRSVHVLDRRGHLVPAGVAAELVLGGALLARGYLHRPELTAERFVPDPVLAAAGRSPLPDWGSRQDAGRRTAGVPGTDRQPGQGARLPHRARRGGGGAAGAPGGARGRGAGARRDAGRLRRDGRRCGLGRRAADAAPGPPPRVHGAVGLSLPDGDAADRERQARPPGARRPAARSRTRGRGRGRRAAHPGRGAGGRHLRRGAGARGGGNRDQLLRAGRSFAAGDPGPVAPPRGVRSEPAGQGAVRGADGRRARRGGDGGAPRDVRVPARASAPGSGSPRRATAALLPAAAAVVHGAAGAGQLDVPHAVRLRDPWRARPPGARRQPDGGRRPPRDPAQPLSRGRRPALAGDRPSGSLPAGAGRPLRPARGTAPAAAGAAWQGGGGTDLRPRPRPAAARRAGAPRRR